MIKKVRVNKKISSNDLYDGLLSRPARVKFEKGESDTTTSKFLIMLDRLNITLEEFQFILDKDSNYAYFLKEYYTAFYNKDIDQLEKISAKAKENYQVKRDEKYLHHSALINLLIDYLNKNNDHEDEITIIKNYLFNCENWGYYELTLFTNSLTFFPEEVIDLVYKQVKKKYMSYKELNLYRNELSIVILNILEKKFLIYNFESAKFYVNELKQFKHSLLDNMYIQIMIKYFESLIEISSGNKEAEKNIKKICDTFNFLSMNLKAEQCLSLYEHIKKQDKTSES